MTRSNFIEILMILTKYLFHLGVRLTDFSVTVESVTLRFYCIPHNKSEDTSQERQERGCGVSCETKFLNVKTILYKAYAN